MVTSTRHPASEHRLAGAFDHTCVARTVLDTITDRWTALVIHLLSERPHRFGALRREIGGISQKMLTQTLRKLERDGLVSRHVYPTTPPSVEYTLTPVGQTLTGPLCALTAWSESHIDEVLTARAAFDARAAAAAAPSPAAGSPSPSTG